MAFGKKREKKNYEIEKHYVNIRIINIFYLNLLELCKYNFLGSLSSDEFKIANFSASRYIEANELSWDLFSNRTAHLTSAFWSIILIFEKKIKRLNYTDL